MLSRLPLQGAPMAVLGVVVAVLVPVVVTDAYLLDLFCLIAIYVLLCLGMNFTFGYTGQISLAHVAFWAIGAYSTAILTAVSGWPPLLAALAGVVLAVAVAAPVGLSTKRLSGHYLALGTLAVTAIVQLLLLNQIDLTGGTNGLGGIPPAGIGPLEADGPVSRYYVLVAVVGLGALVAWRWQTSRYGRMCLALRDSELVARSLGVGTGGLKVTTLMISAAYAAVAGSLYAHHVQFVSPDVFGFGELFKIVTMLIVGGLGTIGGAFLGPMVVVFAQEWFRELDEYWQLVYAVLLLVLVLRLPSGLVGALRLVRRRVRSAPQDRAVEPAAEPEVVR